MCYMYFNILPGGGGTNKSNFPSRFVNGQIRPMVCLNSWSA